MRFFRFDRASGTSVTDFGSINLVYTQLARLGKDAQLGSLYMGPRGKIGYQPTKLPQLFMVVQGECWVRGEEGKHDIRRTLGVGQAVFWDAGELHEIVSPYGATALVIESATLDPARFLKETA